MTTTTHTPGLRDHRDECAETQDKDSDPDHCVSCCAEYEAEIEADRDRWKAAHWIALRRGDRLLLKLDKARSAAPDMLEALRKLNDMTKRHPLADSLEGRAIRSVAEAAIAKAEGKA